MDGGFLRNIGNETNDHDSCVEIAGAGDTEEQMHASKLKEIRACRPCKHVHEVAGCHIRMRTREDMCASDAMPI